MWVVECVGRCWHAARKGLVAFLQADLLRAAEEAILECFLMAKEKSLPYIIREWVCALPRGLQLVAAARCLPCAPELAAHPARSRLAAMPSEGALQVTTRPRDMSWTSSALSTVPCSLRQVMLDAYDSFFVARYVTGNSGDVRPWEQRVDEDAAGGGAALPAAAERRSEPATVQSTVPTCERGDFGIRRLFWLARPIAPPGEQHAALQEHLSAIACSDAAQHPDPRDVTGTAEY